jgi:hypothetical protein
MNMDYDDNERLGRSLNLQARIMDWLFLPIPVALMVVGVGMLTGLMFKDNFMLQGSWKVIIGGSLTAYGLFRSVLISRRIWSRKKDTLWIKKS